MNTQAMTHWDLLQLFDSGYPMRHIAKRAGLPYEQVRVTLHNGGCFTETGRRGLYNMHQIAEVIFGGNLSRLTVNRWVRDGILKPIRLRRRKFSTCWIPEEEVIHLLEKPHKWMAWDPDWITVPELRTYALQLRSGVSWRWITCEAAAELLLCGRRTVNSYIERGLLPGVYEARRVWVRSDHVAWFTRNPERLHLLCGSRWDLVRRIEIVRAGLAELDRSPGVAA